MKILDKFLELFYTLLGRWQQYKLEKEERVRIIIEQQQRTTKLLSKTKDRKFPESTDEDFFGDGC